MTLSSSWMPTEDIQLVKRRGVPADPGTEYVSRGEDGAFELTDRGRRLYRFACLMHGLSPRLVDDVRDAHDLRGLSEEIKRARLIFYLDELARAQRGGRVPVKARGIAEAAMHGTAEDLHAAVQHRLACEAAGPNVIPVQFQRLRR